jgi:hypothetical protein
MVAFFCASIHGQPAGRSVPLQLGFQLRKALIGPARCHQGWMKLTANLTTYLETQGKCGVKGLGKCVDVTGRVQKASLIESEGGEEG